jgi:hypothetical protein
MDTVRERALAELEAVIAGITEGQPAADPYPLGFSYVERGPLPDNTAGKRYAVGIVDGTERKNHKTGRVEPALQVFLEFRAYKDQNLSPSQTANQVLGVLQRVVMENSTLNGKVIDLREIGSEIDLESSHDRTVQGTLFLSLIYRHGERDPRKVV